MLAGLAVVDVAWQFVAAGQLFAIGAPDEVHAAAAIVGLVLVAVTSFRVTVPHA